MSRLPPPIYKIGNWPAYNEALRRRGSLTIWLHPEMNWDPALTGKRGRQQTYSDAAIQICRTIMHNALRMLYPDAGTAFHSDAAAAAKVRRDKLSEYAASEIIVFCNHFPGQSAGHVRRHGDGFHFVPLEI